MAPNERVALICPGQGSQVPGGVATLPDSARAVFARASAIVGEDLWEIGLRGEQDALALPSVLQPYLVAWAVADYERGRAERDDLPAIDYVLGHSSGENSAMVLSGAVTFEDGVRFAHERGRHLDAACASAETGLLALAGAEREAAEAIARDAGLELANQNGRDQFVFGGRRADVERAAALAEERGVAGVVLRVAAAFHTETFRPADEATEPLIAALPIADRFRSMIGNARGQLITDAAGLRDELSYQYTRPIEWVAALQTAYEAGVRTFVVTGPGNAMSGLVRRFGREVAETLRTIRLNPASTGPRSSDPI